MSFLTSAFLIVLAARADAGLTLADLVAQTPAPPILFVGDDEEHARFICALERLGYDAGSLLMPNETAWNGVDDNGDQLIDNAFGWDGIRGQPFSRASDHVRSSRTVPVHPFLMKRSQVDLTQLAVISALDLLGFDAKSKTAGPASIYVFIPDEQMRGRFLAMIAPDRRITVMGHRLESCGPLTN